MSIVTYKTANTIPIGGPSPIIWADCPVIAMQKDPGKGIHFMEDFLGKYTNLTAAGKLIGTPFELVDDGGDAILVQDTSGFDVEHGVIEFEPDGAAQYDEAYLVSQILYNKLALGSGRKLWFEAKFKLSDFDSDLSIICGLGDSTLLAGSSVIEEAAVPDTIESRDFVGFVAFTDGTSTSSFDALYHEAGDSAITDVKNAAGSLSADDTYIKLGLKYDGVQYLYYYFNGVEVGRLDVDDFASNTANQIGALGIILGSMCGNAPGAGSAATINPDWIRFACERNAAV